MALSLVLLGGIYFLAHFDRPPAVTILPPTPLNVKSGRAPDRWIPVKWVWLRRACGFVFGLPRQVGFDIQFVKATEPVALIVAQNSLGPPQAQSNGLAGWILPVGTQHSLKGTESIVWWPGALTTDRTEASLHSRGVIPIDYGAHLFPRLEKDRVDLSTYFSAISPVQPCFFAAVRAQLPYGKRLFVLDVRQPELATNRFGFLVTAEEYDAKGKKVKR
jgi:hypothetical protein